MISGISLSNVLQAQLKSLLATARPGIIIGKKRRRYREAYKKNLPTLMGVPAQVSIDEIDRNQTWTHV